MKTPLDGELRLKVASPCRVSWEGMTGDERVRFCSQCKKHVYNLSTMQRDEAVELVQRTEGKICGRFYQRKDGTVLTADCPVGVAAHRRVLAAAAVLTFALIAFPVLVAAAGRGDRSVKINWDGMVAAARRAPVIGPVVNYLAPEPVLLMGDVAPPP